jgi:hypothetical protein
MSNDNVIGADEMQVWRADRVTRKFLEFVTSKREYVLNGLERGEFLNMENPYVTHANIAKAWGRVEGLNAIIEMMQENNGERPNQDG